MLLFRTFIVAIFCILLSYFGQNAFAAGSGAFRDETVDATTLSMGNAFAGEADTPAAVYYNPAGLNQISSSAITLSDAIIAPRGSFKDLSGNTTQMRNNEFDIPTFYAVVPIVKNMFTIGVGAGSYWGLGTEWAPDSFSKYVATKTDLKNTDSMLTGAYQVTNQWSIAAGVDNDFSQADENKKFQNLGGEPDGNVELKAKDDAWGFRLATLFKINEQNQFGLMYRSPIQHDYVGHVYVDGIGPIYSGALFGGAASYETRVTEKLVLPQSVVLGYSFKPTNKWTINADLEWMDWSSIKRETLNFPDAGAGPSTFLNGANTIPHDWTSTISESIGIQYAATDRLRLRGGVYHHPEVGSQDGFDSAVPDLDAYGFTLGFGFDLTSHLTVDVGYSAQTYRPRKVDTTLGSGALNGTYYQFINDGVVSLTYKF